MMTQKFLLISYIFLAILFFFGTSPVTSQEVDDEMDFSYKSGSETGPEHWGELHRNWSACGKGKLQSPIDLSDERVQVRHRLGPLRSSCRPSNAVMKNRGHDIEVSTRQSRDTQCLE